MNLFPDMNAVSAANEEDLARRRDPNRAPRLTVIADREWLNLESIIWHINENPNALELVGIITPFHDIDQEIFGLIGMYNPTSNGGRAPISDEHVSNPNGFPDFCFTDKNGIEKVSFLHRPYKKGMTDQERAEYGEQLLSALGSQQPDYIFLSNFKLILPENFVRGYEGRIINVHPSVLPYNRGWRTERMAIEADFDHASGYTFHVVVPDLDVGPTLAQQRIPIANHDEETLRLEIISKQSMYVAKVLSLYASGRERKIITGKEAIDSEGRSIDAADTGNYQRIVFKTNRGFKTMEYILDIPAESEARDIHPIRRYIFEVGYDGINSTDAIIKMQEILGGVGIMDQRMVSMMKNDGTGQDAPVIRFEIRAMSPEIGEILARKGIPYAVDTFPMSVTAKRRPGNFAPSISY